MDTMEHSLPPEMGAHGKRATFSGSCGCLAPDAQKRAVEKAHSGMGAKEGRASEIDSEDRKGSFEPDESVREYTGYPRDSAGHVGNMGVKNRVPGR